MNKNKVIKKNKGFTIVETLVAITILMISIAGPLTIAQKGLTSAIYARDQVIATFLAQDLMEYIKNIRDNNVNNINNTGSGTWLDGLSCGSSNGCAFDTLANAGSSQTCGANDCWLYISNTGGYSMDSSLGRKSQFQRYFKINSISSDEVAVTVTVTWQNGTISNVVNLEDELFNISR